MPIQVLLVEDSPGDVRLTQEAFRDANRSIRLHVAADGVEAMAFLRHEGAHVHAPRPDLILLDLRVFPLPNRFVRPRCSCRIGGRRLIAWGRARAIAVHVPTWADAPSRESRSGSRRRLGSEYPESRRR